MWSLDLESSPLLENWAFNIKLLHFRKNEENYSFCKTMTICCLTPSRPYMNEVLLWRVSRLINLFHRLAWAGFCFHLGLTSLIFTSGIFKPFSITINLPKHQKEIRKQKFPNSPSQPMLLIPQLPLSNSQIIIRQFHYFSRLCTLNYIWA